MRHKYRYSHFLCSLFVIQRTSQENKVDLPYIRRLCAGYFFLATEALREKGKIDYACINLTHGVYYFNFSILLYNAWRLMSRSAKNLIQIRGHRSQDKLRSSVLSHIFRFFFWTDQDLATFFYFHIFFHFFEFQSFTQTLISLSVLSFDHDFHQFSDRHFSFPFFYKKF